MTGHWEVRQVEPGGMPARWLAEFDDAQMARLVFDQLAERDQAGGVQRQLRLLDPAGTVVDERGQLPPARSGHARWCRLNHPPSAWCRVSLGRVDLGQVAADADRVHNGRTDEVELRLAGQPQPISMPVARARTLGALLVLGADVSERVIR